MTFLGKLLSLYGLDETGLAEREKASSLSDIRDPFSFFGGFKEALSLIEKHIALHDKIVIYGDYDCDGLCSTSILVKALLRKGVKPGFFIPSRYKEGYGLTLARTQEFIKKDYKLLICSDNGIAAFEGIKAAKDGGMDVLVIDHHTPGEILPPADAFIHPSLGKYSSYNISAAGLALLVSYGLNGVYDPYLGALAGLCVFSDSMPLNGEVNLILAKHALKILSSHAYKQFEYLLGGKKGDINSNDVNFSVVSKLNSIGRLDTGLKINRIVNFLISDESSEIAELSSFVNAVSAEKKQRMASLNAEIASLPMQSGLEIYKLEDAPIGLIGALASSKADKDQEPVIIFGKHPEDSSLLVGSGRAKEGMDLYSLVSQMKDFLVAFGGHKAALGLTIKAADFERFASELKKKAQEEGLSGQERKEVLLDESEINLSSIAVLKRFEPFGEGFKAPLFVLPVKREGLFVSKDGKHLMGQVGAEGSLIYFNYPKELDKKTSETFYLKGSLNVNEFNGRTKAQFSASDWSESLIAATIR